MSRDTAQLLQELHESDRKFRRAGRQIIILSNKIKDLNARYQRAQKEDRKTFRYTLRLQLATIEGMRNMFYEYLARKAEELDAIQDQLVEAGAMSDTEEDVDWDVDDVWVWIQSLQHRFNADPHLNGPSQGHQILKEKVYIHVE